MTDAMMVRLAEGRVRSYANLRVLSELELAHVPATFFLASKWVQAYPDVTRRIARNPLFEIGSHSYAHEAFALPCYGLAGLRASQMAADIQRSFATLAPFGGHQSRYFRFPGGCYDQRSLRAIAGTRVTVIGFDVVSGDAFSNDPSLIAHTVLDRVRPGSIIVLHITEANAPATDRALPLILAGLRADRYQFRTVSALLGSAQ